MSVMPSEFDPEFSLGGFDVALSYASDAGQFPQKFAQFAAAYDLKMYKYEDFIDQQLGLDIYEVMRYVFSTIRRCVVFNTTSYRSSKPTEFEYQILSDRMNDLDIVVVEMGGRPLEFGLDHKTILGSELTDKYLIDLCLSWRSSLYRN